jgi:hypothetical protein
MALVPDGVRHRVGDAAHFDEAFTRVDSETRARYHRRITYGS